MSDQNQEVAAEEVVEHEASVDEAAENEANKKLMKDPEVLAALQRHLISMGPSPADYVRSLPKSVKRRLKALKKLQAESLRVESRFFEEVHQLECKYEAIYKPLLEKRRDIVTATTEPTDEECDWPSEDEDDSLSEEMKAKAKIEEVKADAGEDVAGIPDFWLTVFKNVDMLSEMIQEHDEPILKHLLDIKLKLVPSTGFTLSFIFEPNEYFNNPMLTKEYSYRFSVDEEDVLSYEGPEIVKSVGCSIDWKKGNNVTEKQIKKVQKHKGSGTRRTINKTVKVESFFNFFSPPTVTAGEEPDEDLETLLATDFETGHFIREHIVPRAVLYFTGEALDDDDDEYDDGEGDDENEDDIEDDDEDDDEIMSHPAILPKGSKKK